MKLTDLKALNEARAARRSCAVITPLDGSPGRLVFPENAAADPLGADLVARFASGKSGRVADGAMFVAIHRPPPRLVVIGAVHVTQALAPMAIQAGFDLTIIDPREAFATPERFGDYTLLAQWPDAQNIEPDRETAVATLTHDPKIDDPALIAALRADCFYIGALGSRKTHGKRVERLTAEGFGPEDIARIRAPIGLPIGATAPAEIAVSVLAEIIGALRGAEAVTAAKAAA